MLEAFKVAVELKLVDHFSAVFEAATKLIAAASADSEKLQKQFEQIGMKFKIGMESSIGGFGMLRALKASTDEAVRYEQQLNRLKGLNLGDSVTKGLQDQARQISESVKGTSNADALGLVTQTQVATGNAEHTKMLAPVLAQLRFSMESYMSSHGEGEGRGEEAESQFQALVKVMEARGMMRDLSPGKLDRMADLFAKNFVATGGVVQPTEFLEMIKAGGVGARAMSDDFTLAMGHIMREKGGANAGAALMSGYQNMAAGKMPPQSAEMLEKLGLLKESAIHRDGKKIVSVDAGGLKDTALFESRPDLYLQQNILPNLEKKFHVDTHDQQAVLRQLSSLSGQDSSSDLFAQLYLERDQIASYMAQSKNVIGYKALYRQEGASTAGQELDLRAQAGKLEEAFADAALPLLKNALQQTIPLVKEFGKWLGEHPEGLSMLVKGLAAIAALAVVGGPLMMAGSALQLFSMGATKLARPLGNLAASLALREVGGAQGLADLAGKLGSAGGQLKLLGQVASVFAAYEFGHWVGSMIYDNLSQEHRDGLGEGIAKVLSIFGNDDAKESLAAMKKAEDLSPNEISRRAIAASKNATHVTSPPSADASGNGQSQAQQAMPDVHNHITVVLDGKEIQSTLISKTSLSTGDYNPFAQILSPSMGNVGIP